MDKTRHLRMSCWALGSIFHNFWHFMNQTTNWLIKKIINSLTDNENDHLLQPWLYCYYYKQGEVALTKRNSSVNAQWPQQAPDRIATKYHKSLVSIITNIIEQRAKWHSFNRNFTLRASQTNNYDRKDSCLVAACVQGQCTKMHNLMQGPQNTGLLWKM